MMNQATLVNRGTKTRPIQNELQQELVQRACQGDAEAFGELYGLCVDRVYRYIYFRVSDDETAEDLTSRVFLKAWEHLPRFRIGSSPFIAWLYTIAHNIVIDHYRTSKQTAPLDEIATLPDRGPLPQEQCEHRSEADVLRQALRQLTPDQREVVTMKLLDGLTTDQVAARLRKTPGAVRALQMRGLQALAKICRQ